MSNDFSHYSANPDREFDSYNDFLKSDKWKEVSVRVKQRDNCRCVICGTEKDIQAHHIVYRGDLLNENDIITLCKRCHLCMHSALERFKDCYLKSKREMYLLMNEVLSDIVVDFYNNSFIQGDSEININRRDDFLNLRFLLKTNIEHQIRGNQRGIDLLEMLHNSCFEIDSRNKISKLQQKYVTEMLADGYTPSQIRNKLNMTYQHYNKILKRINKELK